MASVSAFGVCPEAAPNADSSANEIRATFRICHHPCRHSCQAIGLSIPERRRQAHRIGKGRSRRTQVPDR